MTDETKSGAMWKWGIAVSIAVCIIFFVGLAIWTSLGDVELVYDNYYAKDVVFEQQIRRVERTDALLEKPVLSYQQSKQVLSIAFPERIRDADLRGNMLLFRPADLHQDRTFQLKLIGDSLQTIPVPDLDPGLWRLKLSWATKGLEYFHEQSLMVE